MNLSLFRQAKVYYEAFNQKETTEPHYQEVSDANIMTVSLDNEVVYLELP